jgi:hypothetical protein
MRGGAPLLVLTLALGLAFAWVQGAGLAAAWGVGDDPVPEGTAAQDVLDDAANDSATSQGGAITGDAGTENGDSNIVSLILSSATRVATILGYVLVLPAVLVELGFPAWFALPLGGVVSLVVTIAIAEWVSGRVFN